ncbi:DUF4817 domain-containing protein [Trichonephila clavipes]|nr:DUF4817 domain-containing protein [Trichonephila clavipes]
MLSAPDKALLVKLFYLNEESATIALRKFRVQKNVKSGKGPLTPAGLLKFVKRFEETGKLEDRARAGRPYFEKKHVHPALLSKWKRLRPKQLQGPTVLVKLPDDWAYHHHLSAILFVESSNCTHTNCNRAMNFCQQIPHRRKHVRSGPSLKWNRIPPGFLTSCGQMKLISCFMVTLTTITVPFGRPLIHVSTHRSHCILEKGQHGVWFHGFIYHRTLFFETQCPVNGWITETVNAQRYLTLRRETVVPCLIQRGQIANVTFMQDGATSHAANPVKAFLIQTFGEDRI